MAAKVTHLRYIGWGIPDFDKAVEFYGGAWGLKKVDGDKDIAFFQAEGDPENYIYRLRRAEEKRLDVIGFAAESQADVDELATSLAADGVRFASEPGQLQTPGGGYGFRFFDPDGRTLEVSCDVEERPYRVLDERESVPEKLSHIVVNSPQPDVTSRFYLDKLGFKLSDWIQMMSFFRCSPEHHSIAIAAGQHVSVNHVAFEMHGIDEVMRGSGRILDQGARVMMGPGRHSGGDNAFFYFFDPVGNVSEYTSDVERILDDEAWNARLHNTGDVWKVAAGPTGQRGMDFPPNEVTPFGFPPPGGRPPPPARPPETSGGPVPGTPAASGQSTPSAPQRGPGGSGPDIAPTPHAMQTGDPGIWIAPPV